MTRPCTGASRHAVHRFFDFVDDRGPSCSALARGGPAPGSARARFVGSVRQAASVQILAHLKVQNPPARLELVIRSWISLVASTALIWLDGRRIPRREPETQLVHDFAALTTVSAVHDDERGALLRRILGDEPADGPFGDLEALVTLAS